MATGPLHRYRSCARKLKSFASSGSSSSQHRGKLNLAKLLCARDGDKKPTVLKDYLAKDASGADPLKFVKDEFEAFPECGIMAHGLLHLRFSNRVDDPLTRKNCYSG